MNLKFIDRVIKAYEADLPEGDMKRLKFFYGMWEDMDRWSKGPTTADKHYAVPSEEVLEEAWIADKPVFSVCTCKAFEGTLLRHLLQLARVCVRRGAAFRRGFGGTS